MKNIALAVALFAPLALAGCSKFRYFEAETIIRDAVTGKPISGVSISEAGDTVVTNSEGKARARFRVSYYAFDDNGKYRGKKRIKLKISKKGYETEVLDVTPEDEPTTNPTTLHYRIYMRPAKSAKPSGAGQ